MIPSQEFKVGKHNIGYISSDFLSRMGDAPFEMKGMPSKVQTLPRSMTDAEIESELKPGLCDLGDILSFLDTAPQECKDGNYNLFYTKDFVVSVSWDGWLGAWYVVAWYRHGRLWVANRRVFSPATESSGSQPSALGSFVPYAEFLEFKKQVEAVLKLQ